MSDALVFTLIEAAHDLHLVVIARTLGDVIALSVSPPRVEDDPLVEARARGASRAVRVWDDSLADVDYLGIAHVLACGVRHLAEVRSEGGGSVVTMPVIVLASDRGRGAVGPAVAERLALPHLGAVRAVEMRDGQLVVDRHRGAELRRYLGPPPVVLLCTPVAAPFSAMSEPTEVETLALSTLQITTPELAYRRRFRPSKGNIAPVRPHAVSNLETLGDRLARDGLWPLPRAESEA